VSYTLVDDELTERLAHSPAERSGWLFLEPHEEFIGQWSVRSFDPQFFFDLKEIVGPYRAVSPSGLEKFLEVATEHGYKVAFFDDPTTILDAFDRLNEIPEVSINSPFENTINGFLPFQVQGYNFLKDLKAGVAMWSTGTGKTVLSAGLIKYHLMKEDFDTAFFVVKSHNRTNTKRALYRLADIDQSVVVDGTKARRRKLYDQALEVPGGVIVTNYEKFRADPDEMQTIFEDRRILCVWDEMPTRLRTRTTKLYKAVCGAIYTTNPPIVSANAFRPSDIRQYMLSATPIENDPQDWFNCIRLKDPTIYGTVREFESEYVRSFNFFDQNKPETWHKLDKMGLKTAHITHQVEKEDPDIAKQFPAYVEEPYYIDWNPKQRKIYDTLLKAADDPDIGIFTALAVLQMLCNAPSILHNSAAMYEAYEEMVENWEVGDTEPPKKGSKVAQLLVEVFGDEITDEGHTKLEVLEDLVMKKHRDEKIVIFTAMNKSIMPILTKKLEEWGVSYVQYGGTMKQRQAAEDAFRDDPDIQVFLSSDMGSDSINLEVASVVIHYDLPWKWSTKIQRQNRIHRVSSLHNGVIYYTLMMADSIEERKDKVIARKKAFHDGVFKGAIADQSASARMTREDLLFILRG
jgi:SNF2 family DNA or RNA helicase